MGLGIGGILAAGLVASWILSSSVEDEVAREQTSNLQLVSSLLLDPAFENLSPPERNRLIATLSAGLAMDVTIIRKDGTVVFESAQARLGLGSGTNHRERPEVVQAISGTVGHFRQGDLYSSALRLSGKFPDGLDKGFVIVTTLGHDSGFSHARIENVLLGSAIAALVVLAIASLSVSRGISEPVISIVGTVNRIREGETTARITGDYPTELSDLARAINSMAEKLGADITKLERLERVRSEFLGNVSHELRTPIFSLQGFLETLLDGAVDDPTVNRDFLAKAHAHSERLNNLLNDLIEISRIESGEMKMSFRYFSILDFLQGIVEELKPIASAKQITVSLESEFDSAAKVYGDKSRLRQVMINLIDNAIKYNDSGGSVTCIARAVHNQCEIVIRDSGNGIPAEHLPRIFERFYRVDRDRSREVGGTGLGLAIVKHIVEAHGAAIQVSSVVGKGSVFSFKLKR